MKPLSRRVYALTAIALGVVLFIALNIVSNAWLGSAQLDLTADRLYTVSAGTKATLQKIPEPVTLAQIGIGSVSSNSMVPMRRSSAQRRMPMAGTRNR